MSDMPNVRNEFSSAEDARQFLRGRLPGLSAVGDPELAKFVADTDLLVKELVESVPPPGGFPMLSKSFRWVIRNDDLNLLDCILEGLRSTASAGFFMAAGVPAPAKWGAIVGVVAALLKVSRAVALRGKQLDADHFCVASALKLGGPATDATLAAKLAESDPTWDVAKVRRCLEALQAMPMTDGTMRELASKSPNGNWQASGI